MKLKKPNKELEEEWLEKGREMRQGGNGNGQGGQEGGWRGARDNVVFFLRNPN